MIHYVVSDSVKFLNEFEDTIHLLYLDSSDDPQIIMDELLVAYDSLAKCSFVVIDDTHYSMTEGKGVLACKHLLENGWTVLLDLHGQVVFTNMSSITFTPYSFLPVGGRGSFSTLYENEQYEVEDEIKLRLEDYDEKATVWFEILSEALPEVEGVVDVRGAKRVLDVGCNTGYNTKMLEEKYGYAVGVDINKELINYSVLNHDKCYHMNAEKMDFDDESFSLVVAKDVLEHTQDPDAVLEEVYRVLADGGYLVCMVPLDGESVGIDEIAVHPAFNYGNESHIWKATIDSVLTRLFNLGFSEMEYNISEHSRLFGTARPLGDRVVTIRAKKIRDMVKVPTKWLVGTAYWAAFLTFNCTGNCKYCIQLLSKDEFMDAKLEYARTTIKPEEWVTFYNSLQRFKRQQLSLIGGEPTMYNGFFDVVNGLEGYYRTVTTNLCAPCFEDIPGKFDANIQSEKKEMIRINTSFHPKLISVDEFSNRVHQLRDLGYMVDQIAMVDHPTSNFQYYCTEFVKRGLAIAPQTFLGKANDILLPHPEFNIATNHNEHGIDNYDLYEEGFSCKSKSKVLCMTRRFLVAPNGNIFRCHYHAYSNSSPVGSIFDGVLPSSSDYIECKDYGYCNPCDYPHAKFRSMEINVPNILLSMSDNKEFVRALVEDLNNSPERFKELMIDVVAELYHSDNPYWELYHNDEIRKLINDFILEGGHINNSNAMLVAYLDGNLFRMLNHGINIYRLLEEEALLKYIDALGCVILDVIKNTPLVTNRFYNAELCEALGPELASIMVSLGLATYSGDRIYFVETGRGA